MKRFISIHLLLLFAIFPSINFSQPEYKKFENIATSPFPPFESLDSLPLKSLKVIEDNGDEFFQAKTTTYYEFNKSGNMVLSVTNHSQGGRVSEARDSTLWSYDEKGRLTLFEKRGYTMNYTETHTYRVSGMDSVATITSRLWDFMDPDNQHFINGITIDSCWHNKDTLLIFSVRDSFEYFSRSFPAKGNSTIREAFSFVPGYPGKMSNYSLHRETRDDAGHVIEEVSTSTYDFHWKTEAEKLGLIKSMKPEAENFIQSFYQDHPDSMIRGEVENPEKIFFKDEVCRYYMNHQQEMPVNVKETWLYSENGKLTKMSYEGYGMGPDWTNYKYDKKGRLIRIEYMERQGKTVWNEEFVYELSDLPKEKISTSEEGYKRHTFYEYTFYPSEK